MPNQLLGGNNKEIYGKCSVISKEDDIIFLFCPSLM